MKKSNRFLFIFSILLLIPFFLFAQSSTSTQSLIAELQSQIKALQTRILELETELGVKPATPASPEATQDKQILMPSIQFPTFTTTLSLGNRGDDVRNLQTFLVQFPDLYPEGLITGYYGPLTEKAVQLWQVKEGIVAFGTSDTTGYGRIGPKTRAKLNELITQGAGKSGVIPSGLLKAPGLQNKIATTTPGATTTPITTATIATTTPTTTATTTPSGTVPATPAQPIGQTGTTTVSATPTTPTQTSGGTTPPPSTAPPPSPIPPPSTATTTPSTGDATAPAILNVQVINITSNSATASWTTNEAASSNVFYSTDASVMISPTRVHKTGTTNTTSFSISLSGLLSFKTYYYLVSSSDASGNTATSTETLFTTLASGPSTQCNDAIDNDGDGKIDMNDLDCLSPTDNNESPDVAPIISNVQVAFAAQSPTAENPWKATMTWTTNKLTSRYLIYGNGCLLCAPGESIGVAGAWISPGSTNHAWTTISIPASALYYYKIVVTDATGVTATHESTFITPSSISTSLSVKPPSLALLLQSIAAILDDIQKQIQKLAR